MSITSDLKRDEGEVIVAGRHMPYTCPAGKTTIGYGRNIESGGISQAEAEMLLQNDIIGCTIHLRNVFPNWDNFSSDRQDALINMRFNLGRSGFLSFKRLIAAVRAGDWLAASEEAQDSKAFRDSKARGSARWIRICSKLRG